MIEKQTQPGLVFNQQSSINNVLFAPLPVFPGARYRR